tara:strand:- start:806 stop:1732 length:927 start_codon:yes stop_codon:yes gene_type:complete
MGNDLNIKSSTIEKGIELAKDFLDKLIMPAVEETGLLIKEKVTYWKFKNQVKILNKAKEYCEKNGIKPKTISFKLLVPLIETSALEEDEVLQDKWAILLTNMVDSEQNVENHVFPYILGQISTNEYLFLEQVYFSKRERLGKLEKELEQFRQHKPKIENELQSEIEKIQLDIEKAEKTETKSVPYNREVWDLQKKKRGFENKLSSLKYRENRILRQMQYPEVIPEDELRDYELSNLIRLGLVKSVQETIANPQRLDIPKHKEDDWNDYVSVDVEIDIESNIEHILTELGELFIDACTLKKIKTAPNTI